MYGADWRSIYASLFSADGLNVGFGVSCRSLISCNTSSIYASLIINYSQDNSPIRPITNWINIPPYKLTMLYIHVLEHYGPLLPHSFKPLEMTILYTKYIHSWSPKKCISYI
jgi:hypothetical protein